MLQETELARSCGRVSQCSQTLPEGEGGGVNVHLPSEPVTQPVQPATNQNYLLAVAGSPVLLQQYVFPDT